MLAPTKVHIRGLDVLKPDDIKAYVAEHFAESPFERIEWIDDSSANLLFESEPIAARALEALAAEPIQDVAILPLKQNLLARPYTQMPDVKLHVRLAVVSDKKQAGAAQRSRFYLLNPEFDPEERRRQWGSDYGSSSRRYRERDGDSRYHRHSYSYSHQYDRDRRRRRYSQDDDDEPPNHFDVSLYDDDEASRAGRAGRPQPTHRRRRSYTPDSERSVSRGDYYRSDNRGKELFPDDGGASNGGRRGSHRRDRTRSPARRDRDGDRDMDLDGDELRDHYRESSTRNNRDRARALKSHMARNSNRDKELFPGKELFPDKTGSGGGGGGSGGRLGDTANTEDPAELLAKGITLPLMDETDDVDPAARTAAKSRRLEDRITAPGRGGGNGNGGSGKLADRITRPGDAAASSGSSSFNIRGTAGGAGQSRGPASQNQGFAIKGSAGKSVRELFPDKFGGGGGGDGGDGDATNGRNGNAGKELFADRIGGRARTRQRAGDLFD